MTGYEILDDHRCLQVEPAFMAEMKTMLVDSDKTQRCFGLLPDRATEAGMSQPLLKPPPPPLGR